MHFVVRRVFDLKTQGSTTVGLELEALISKRIRTLTLAELRDPSRWMQGWIRDEEREHAPGSEIGDGRDS